MDAEVERTDAGGVESTVVAGKPGIRFVYLTTFGRSVIYRNVVVYVEHSGLLYRFHLSYNDGDPNESQHLAAFQSTLNSVQFAP